MHRCTEQRFLREGGLGTIAVVLDVPCGFYTSWERGCATSFFKHLHCCAQIMPKAFVMVMRPAPQRIRHPLQHRNLEDCTTTTNHIIAIFPDNYSSTQTLAPQ
jgi:hypothetical protein